MSAIGLGALHRCVCLKQIHLLFTYLTIVRRSRSIKGEHLFLTILLYNMFSIRMNDELMTCKGICFRHRASKPIGSGRYSSGQKRCQVCEIFIKWDELWCPCCGYRLRTKPRNSAFKERFAIRIRTRTRQQVRTKNSEQGNVPTQVVRY
jgi:hypothetical protein